MIKKFAAVLLCCLFFNLSCTSVQSSEYEFNSNDEPQQYEKDEFPGWMHGLRRAEIIFVGSVPFTILLANIGYSAYQVFSQGINEGYSIENFTSSTALTTEERYNILKISLSLSGVITAADLVIGLFDKAEDE